MRRWSILFVALPLALTSAVASADYSPPPLNDLVLASDVIVSGEIARLSTDTFTFRIDQVVTGAITTPTIEVARFEDWTCAARWAPYAEGQKALLFLRADPGGPYRIRSGGGEGEMPIVAGHVYVNGFYSALAPAAVNAHQRHTVHGGGYVGFRVRTVELITALRRARACFAADIAGRFRRIQRVRVTCDAAHQTSMRATSAGRVLFAILHPG